MVDSTKFGLTQDIEVKFFTPDEASKTPGASSGYNAIYKIGNRIRYELLQAGKVSATPIEEVAVPVAQPVKVQKSSKQNKMTEKVQEAVEQLQPPKEEDTQQ